MGDVFCTCMALHPIELLRRWQVRVEPIMARLQLHSHGASSDALDATIGLIMRMETGHPDLFSPANQGRSHHLPGCDWRRGLKGPGIGPLILAEQRRAADLHRAAAFEEWARGPYSQAVNRWFTGEATGPAAPSA